MIYLDLIPFEITMFKFVLDEMTQVFKKTQPNLEWRSHLVLVLIIYLLYCMFNDLQNLLIGLAVLAYKGS